MRIGCCTGSNSNATILSTSPLAYIEENVQSFLVPLQGDDVFSAKLETAQAAGRPIEAACCFLPGNLPCVGPAVDQPAILAYAATAFHRAAQTGIQRIVFGSGGARRIPEGFSRIAARAQFTALLHQLAPLARRNRLQVVIEPLNPGECNFITTVREGAEIVREVADPSIRLLADLYHMARADETPDDLAAVVDLIEHVHVAEKADRTAPGVAGDDFVPFLAVLRAAGYDQRISLECGRLDLARELVPAVTELSRQWELAGQGALAQAS
jgi:sugar phosphate isomerase/epimerase